MPLILVDLFKKQTKYEAKIKDIEGKIPITTNVATTAILFSVKQRIPTLDQGNSTQKLTGNTTSDFNKRTSDILDAKIKNMS